MSFIPLWLVKNMLLSVTEGPPRLFWINFKSLEPFSESCLNLFVLTLLHLIFLEKYHQSWQRVCLEHPEIHLDLKPVAIQNNPSGSGKCLGRSVAAVRASADGTLCLLSYNGHPRYPPFVDPKQSVHARGGTQVLLAYNTLKKMHVGCTVQSTKVDNHERTCLNLSPGWINRAEKKERMLIGSRHNRQRR